MILVIQNNQNKKKKKIFIALIQKVIKINKKKLTTKMSKNQMKQIQ